MHPLEIYYLKKADRGIKPSDWIGPVYAAPLYLHRGHGIGIVFGTPFLWVRPILWRGSKAVGRETLRTGGKILTDIVENK